MPGSSATGVPTWHELSQGCPNGTGADLGGWLHSPASSICHALTFLVALVLCVVIAARYNSVTALQRRAYPKPTANTRWTVFFALVAAQSAFNTVVYVIRPSSEGFLQIAFVVNTCLQVLNIFWLCLALVYERQYRRTGVARSGDIFWKFSLKSFLKEFCFSCQVIFALQVVACIVALILLETALKESAVAWVLNGCLISEQLSAVCLALLLLSDRNEDSAQNKARIFLMLGMILTSPNILSVFVLKTWTGSCILYVGTLYELFLAFNVFGLILLFLYIREEYLRVVPMCRHALLSGIQSLLDFHHH